MSPSDDEFEALDLFVEPRDFYAPEKPATLTSYITKQNVHIPLRLVGHNPLWGHLLWNAGQVIAKYIEDNAVDVAADRTVLELGAGAGLPSLICALHGAKKVVLTDYPDTDLIENLRYNISHSIDQQYQPAIVAKGYLWGNDPQPLKVELTAPEEGFDLLILADILFNHSEHDKLILTMRQTLGNRHGARALVFFTPYRPWLLEKDLRFFELAKQAGFVVNKLFEHLMDNVMFPEDAGDETLRRTVFAYEIKWPV
ncbi:Protein N-terminal and lysine N-methyltransferase efm7 [Exophiala xenobiotica]|uniref:Protein N-terminal and lysine N-methyltransferase EFM7 n=1 Tax=Lithohypha guttulata TaxID=1690604 RepID=A0ABR0KL45_9EURO|nr:Protein N-terminal and lysine N-methyltransferase efm7 [Lithohypha guttulata]KAK5326060.1 Protein N-terminal and lysine N-methyltransferase efm7 [Exophiala xenobiotica]